MLRWEQMTGEIHPERASPAIDMGMVVQVPENRRLHA
jgi:hypothetical protein